MTYGTEQIISVANMYYKIDASVKNQDYLKTYNIFELGDIAFEGNKSKHFAHGRFVENTIGDGIVSHVFDVFKPITDFDLSFWKYYINYEGVMGPILTRVTKSSTMMTNLVAKDFLKENTLVPSLTEQQKIGEYFSNLDRLITLHQRKLFEAKNNPKNGSKNFFRKIYQKLYKFDFNFKTYDWEQRKFSELAETRRGLTYKPNSIVDNGIRVLRSSNINEDTFVFDDNDVFVDERAVNISYVKNGDILITSANGSSRLVGKHAIIRNLPDNHAVHGGFMLIASSSNPEFLNASMSSQWYSKFVNLYVAGGNGAIGNLNKNDLDKQIVLVPGLAEQKKIGAYFKHLDNLITLHQREVFYTLKHIFYRCCDTLLSGGL